VSVAQFRPIPCLLSVLALVSAASALAQGTIYRCGNEYINDATVAKQRGCIAMQGGNITIIEGTRPTPASTAPAPRNGAAQGSGPRVDNAAQRQRDADARATLEAELRKAEQRLADAQKAYANGEPEKQGIEGRNHQRYLDRVAELKDAVTRAENDVAGIRRELQRLPN
jgi:predicted lipid-binding transport protein (Tim44 family)